MVLIPGKLNKIEKKIAETMNTYHWRMWLPAGDIAHALGKRTSSIQPTLLNMARDHFVEKKQFEEDLCFRLTARGRALLK